MKLIVKPSTLSGTVSIPGSKSHTIRAVALASLADGVSTIRRPLQSADTQAAIDVYRGLGANIHIDGDTWTVMGFGGKPVAPDHELDVKNSGTTLRIALATAALISGGHVMLTGDKQIRSRPLRALIGALNDLGSRVTDINGNGYAPVSVSGTLSGGHTSLEAKTSQFVTSLLINCPAARADTTLDLTLLNEKPYVDITLDWLTRLGIRYEVSDDLMHYAIPGGQSFRSFDRTIPADFSSATFFLAAGAMPGNAVSVLPLDMSDKQGDKAVIEYLNAMGASVTIDDSALTVSVSGGALTGCELDLNATPDALPMIAALASLADGTTRLVNVAQARLKETDRITVMAEELAKMGASVRERDDGLEISGGVLTGAEVDSRDDHRVVMALAVAATQARGETVIRRAEAMAVTFPGFVDTLTSLGADVSLVDG